jgi:predicted metal-dependent phosphoesterase TrpH
MPKLKAQLHVHSKQDPIDGIRHTEKHIIDHAANLGYEVLAISCHNVVIFNDDLKKYAEKKRILLIPAIEKNIQRKHVLILNADIQAQNINTFKDLKEYKKKNKDCLVVAAHPYYRGFTSLGKKLDQNIEIFDAIEYSWYHSRKLNRANKKAVKTAEKHSLPLLGTSDNHLLRYFGSTYSIIEAPKETKAILSAIKKNQLKVISHDIPAWKLLPLVGEMLFWRFIKYFSLK